MNKHFDNTMAGLVHQNDVIRKIEGKFVVTDGKLIFSIKTSESADMEAPYGCFQAEGKAIFFCNIYGSSRFFFGGRELLCISCIDGFLENG